MERVWGENRDNFAADKLGVGKNFTIFLMANEADLIIDIDQMENDLEDVGMMGKGDFFEELRERAIVFQFPRWTQLVGMMPVSGKGKKVYGVVDFTDLKDKEVLH